MEDIKNQENLQGNEWEWKEGSSNDEEWKGEQAIPYSRFKEVNSKVKEMSEELEKFRQIEKKREQDDLIKKWKIEEMYKKEIEEKESVIKQYEEKYFQAEKNNVLKKYGIPDDMWDFVSWSTIEEVEERAKTLSEKLNLSKDEENINKIENEKKEDKKDTKNASLDYSVFFN